MTATPRSRPGTCSTWHQSNPHRTSAIAADGVLTSCRLGRLWRYGFLSRRYVLSLSRSTGALRRPTCDNVALLNGRLREWRDELAGSRTGYHRIPCGASSRQEGYHSDQQHLSQEQVARPPVCSAPASGDTTSVRAQPEEADTQPEAAHERCQPDPAGGRADDDSAPPSGSQLRPIPVRAGR
jgi:hypothetical protein